MVWKAVYHRTKRYVLCKYWYLACIMKWYHSIVSILAAISLHTTACNTGQTIQSNTRKYLRSIRANIAICILLVLQVDSHDAGGKYSQIHTDTCNTYRYTRQHISTSKTYKYCQCTYHLEHSTAGQLILINTYKYPLYIQHMPKHASTQSMSTSTHKYSTNQ